jgi:hypothetical protein
MEMIRLVSSSIVSTLLVFEDEMLPLVTTPPHGKGLSNLYQSATTVTSPVRWSRNTPPRQTWSRTRAGQPWPGS